MYVMQCNEVYVFSSSIPGKGLGGAGNPLVLVYRRGKTRTGTVLAGTVAKAKAKWSGCVLGSVCRVQCMYFVSLRWVGRSVGGGGDRLLVVGVEWEQQLGMYCTVEQPHTCMYVHMHGRADPFTPPRMVSRACGGDNGNMTKVPRVLPLGLCLCSEGGAPTTLLRTYIPTKYTYLNLL